MDFFRDDVAAVVVVVSHSGLPHLELHLLVLIVCQSFSQYSTVLSFTHGNLILKRYFLLLLAFLHVYSLIKSV